jgi:hypothetical protein
MFVAPQQIVGLLTNIRAALDALPENGPITAAPLMGLIGVLAELGDINGFVRASDSQPGAFEDQIGLFAEYEIEAQDHVRSRKRGGRSGTKSSAACAKQQCFRGHADAEPAAEQGITVGKKTVPESDLSLPPQAWFY